MIGALALTGAVGLLLSGAMPAAQDSGDVSPASGSSTLEEARFAMSKWIETQQIISKERNEWQQGKEILLGRLELVKREIATLEEAKTKAQSKVDAAAEKRVALTAEKEELESVGGRLKEAATGLEGEIRRLYRTLPEPLQEKLGQLHERIPEDPATTRVSIAERFQNVLGILNEVNKTNNEITVHYEVHTLADGKPSEVKAVYVGLAQAYFVSARSEAGIGRPSEDGWTWEPSNTIADEVLQTLEILQGKHSPVFVPLPLRIR